MQSGAGYVKMLFAVASFVLATVAVARSQEVPEYRLPTTFKPVSYRLDVTTHLEDEFTFEGVVNIKVWERPKGDEWWWVMIDPRPLFRCRARGPPTPWCCTRTVWTWTPRASRSPTRAARRSRSPTWRSCPRRSWCTSSARRSSWPAASTCWPCRSRATSPTTWSATTGAAMWTPRPIERGSS